MLLRNIRVLEFAWGYAGPIASLALANMGAQVIRVESSTKLDITRSPLPHPLTRKPLEPDASPVFTHANLGKLGVTLDLAEEEGKTIVLELAKVCDVVVCGFKPGVMDNLGLGYDALRRLRPDLVYLATSMVGSTGPDAHLIGWAPMFGALSGLADLTGYKNGPPTEMRVSLDFVVAHNNIMAILAALLHRRDTGQGQFIDVSSVEVLTSFLGEAMLDYEMNGMEQTRAGNDDEQWAPHNCYRCAGEQRWISIAVTSDEEWQDFRQAISNPEWASREEFQRKEGRWQRREELDRLVEQWTVTKDSYEVMRLLQEAGVAAVPSFDSEQLYTDPHIQERGLWQSITQPRLDEYIFIGQPWRLSATPLRVQGPAPMLGADNRFVIEQVLGRSPAAFEALERAGILR